MSREWSPRWPSSRILQTKAALEKWLKEHEVSLDARVYTRDEWEKRREKFGNNALITIAAEGMFNEMMNYPNAYDRKLQEKFRAFYDTLDLFMEQGFSWTWHFYPKDKSGPVLGDAGSRNPKTLFAVLGEIAFFRPSLVLMKGRDYFRIEELIAAGRKIAHADTQEGILVHQTPNFEWDEDSRKKIVIWQEGSQGRRPVYVEPGSEVVA